MKNINILLTPSWDGEKIRELAVDIRMEYPVKAQEQLANIHTKTVYKPFTPLKAPFVFKDELGEVEYEEQEGELDQIWYRSFLAKRDTKGTVKLSYCLDLKEAGENPCFDLGWEKGGMTGSGMTSMPGFPEGEYEYFLEWDLENLPQGARGVWSYGEGAVRRKGNENTLKSTFYTAGLLDGVQMGNFGYYWLFNDVILENAVATSKIFRYESDFFLDSKDPYIIMARHSQQHVERAGGTALERSYMYLYENSSQLDPSWLKFLFAHEMVHNWVDLYNTPFGTGTWYIEGMAEYYSAVLPWRMGIVTKEELCAELNKRAKKYYENPCIRCDNLEAGRKLFADKEMTRIPYGRGFFYLIFADARIREATNGQKCLDDVMKTVMLLQREDKNVGNQTWIREYGRYVGENAARLEYENLSSGGDIIPAIACFGEEIQMEKVTGEVRGTGETCDLWRFF